MDKIRRGRGSSVRDKKMKRKRRMKRFLRKIIRTLRVAAKDIGKLQQNNEAMKMEINQLRRQSLKTKDHAESMKELTAKNAIINELKYEIDKLTKRLDKTEKELEKATTKSNANKYEQNVSPSKIARVNELEDTILRYEEELDAKDADMKAIIDAFDVFRNSVLIVCECVEASLFRPNLMIFRMVAG